MLKRAVWFTLLLSSLLCSPVYANIEDLFWRGIPYPKEIAKEQITHECGVAFVRLRKPITHYANQYNDPSWGLKKLLTLLEMQRHRGQDGAGLAVVKFNTPVGQEYTQRLRFASKTALDSLFEQSMIDVQDLKLEQDEAQWKKSSRYLGEVMLGHIRYATHSGLDINFCQPYSRSHSVSSRNISFAGNFNMTNTNHLLQQLQEWGLTPTSSSDTQIVLDSITYQIDRAYESKSAYSSQSGRKTVAKISENLDLLKVLRNAAEHWDGGYVFCGMLGNGDSFCCRDPAAIRPGYYYINDEVIAVASERVALMDAFNVSAEQVTEITPGHAIVIKHNGEIIQGEFTKPLAKRQCTFERIYFSKANDPHIYLERKALGRNLAQRVYDAVDGDLNNTIFTYVPNSSLPAFYGLIDEINKISKHPHVRNEFLIAKNQKMRTFISSDQERVGIGSRLYEVTRGILRSQDTLVVVDDSLVRGTTFRDLLMSKLTSLNPKRIVLVISAPPVMYPDCYGIDMSQLGKFVAFQAAVEILKERENTALLKEIHTLALQQKKLPAHKVQNLVKRIYANISEKELTDKIAQLITPKDLAWNGEFKIVYQSIDGLHKAMPDFTGDWYFTGEYPTAGGYEVLNTALLNWFDGSSGRSY